MSFVWGSLLPLLGTSCDVCPGFQSQGGLNFMLSCLRAVPRIHLCCDPCWPLVAGTVVHHIPHMLSRGRRPGFERVITCFVFFLTLSRLEVQSTRGRRILLSVKEIEKQLFCRNMLFCLGILSSISIKKLHSTRTFLLENNGNSTNGCRFNWNHSSLTEGHHNIFCLSLRVNSLE